MKFRGDHRAHDPSERIEVVQPRPRPPSNIGVRDRDTTEGREDGNDERIEQDGDLDGRRDGADELGEGDTEQLDEDDDEELESGSVDTRGTLTESHGVDHENPVQDGTEDGVRNLGDQLGNGERLGRVDATVVLADEDHPLEHPQRCQLSLDKSGQNARPETIQHFWSAKGTLKRDTIKALRGEDSRLEITSAGPKLQVT